MLPERADDDRHHETCCEHRFHHRKATDIEGGSLEPESGDHHADTQQPRRTAKQDRDEPDTAGASDRYAVCGLLLQRGARSDPTRGPRSQEDRPPAGSHAPTPLLEDPDHGAPDRASGSATVVGRLQNALRG